MRYTGLGSLESVETAGPDFETPKIYDRQVSLALIGYPVGASGPQGHWEGRVARAIAL
jgi:hypothetical protein